MLIQADNFILICQLAFMELHECSGQINLQKLSNTISATICFTISAEFSEVLRLTEVLMAKHGFQNILAVIIWECIVISCCDVCHLQLYCGE